MTTEATAAAPDAAAAAAAATAAATTATTTEATAAAPWFAEKSLGLDQETIDYLGGKNPPNAAEAFKSMRQFEALARDRNAITAPVAGKEGEWGHWDKLGWVADATKYTVETPKLPDGVAWDPTVQSRLVETMHANKVPLPAAKAAIETLAKVTADGVQAALAADAKYIADEQGKLRAEWGKDYEPKLDLARRVVRAFGTDAALIDQMDDIIGFAPMTRFLAAIGSKMSEDTLVTPAGGGGPSHPATARAERLRLENDQAFMAAYTDPRHPSHADNVARRNALLAKEAVK